ncbi:MAG: hypothetical protein HY517_02820 [Candidatus Aenigmarchaeota archaeon]|nr:hypothetical protein [Candidatus Aenigmarchaeota archaeon]
MSIIDSLLRRQTALRLRKEYDRLRERADKLNPIEKRLEVLRMLDQAEPSIVSLEEHHMSGYEKKKVFSYVQPILRKAKFMIEETKKAAKEKNAEFKDEDGNNR